MSRPPHQAVLAVGVEAESSRIQALLTELTGKDLAAVIAEGKTKLAAMPAGGGAAPAAAAGGAAPAAKKEEKKEEKPESDEVRCPCRAACMPAHGASGNGLRLHVGLCGDYLRPYFLSVCHAQDMGFSLFD